MVGIVVELSGVNVVVIVDVVVILDVVLILDVVVILDVVLVEVVKWARRELAGVGAGWAGGG